MFGQYKRLTNNFHGVLTGKSMEYGGIRLRPEATGYGNCFFAREMLTQRDETIEGKKCLISGSGNVALYTAEKLLDLGAQVLTLSDSNGFIYDKDGINKDKLAFLKQLKFEKQGRIKEYADQYGCEFHADQKPWSVPGDLAFPSATQNELDVDDARQLIENECTLVSEGANMPCTSEAVKALIEAGVLFGPGKAANAGGVAVSGLEMSQNATGLPWSQERVLQELESIMNSIHEKCLEYGSTDQGIDYVKGANLAGYVRVAEAMIAQGVV
jgi:glutamate dehydrogenase/leucine dehydrogenase